MLERGVCEFAHSFFHWLLHSFGWKITEKKNTKIIHDAFTMQKGYIKCTVAQKKRINPHINHAITVDIKIHLQKKFNTFYNRYQLP